MVCNYHPKGNIPGKPVYKIGQPCTNCSTQRFVCSKIFSGLCGLDFSASSGNYLKYSFNILFITICVAMMMIL